MYPVFTDVTSCVRDIRLQPRSSWDLRSAGISRDE